MLVSEMITRSRRKAVDLDSVVADRAADDAVYLEAINDKYLKWFERVEKRVTDLPGGAMGWRSVASSPVMIGARSNLIEVLAVGWAHEATNPESAVLPFYRSTELIRMEPSDIRFVGPQQSTDAPTGYALERLAAEDEDTAVVVTVTNFCDVAAGAGISQITRNDGGSFVTDGVRVGSLIGGAVAAFFPASTYVCFVTATILYTSQPTKTASAGGANVTGTFTGGSTDPTIGRWRLTLNAAPNDDTHFFPALVRVYPNRLTTTDHPDVNDVACYMLADMAAAEVAGMFGEDEDAIQKILRGIPDDVLHQMEMTIETLTAPRIKPGERAS